MCCHLKKVFFHQGKLLKEKIRGGFQYFLMSALNYGVITRVEVVDLMVFNGCCVASCFLFELNKGKLFKFSFSLYQKYIRAAQCSSSFVFN